MIKNVYSLKSSKSSSDFVSSSSRLFVSLVLIFKSTNLGLEARRPSFNNSTQPSYKSHKISQIHYKKPKLTFINSRAIRPIFIESSRPE